MGLVFGLGLVPDEANILPNMDDDMFGDVEEDVDVHELKLVETLEQDHFDISCFYEPLESFLTNSCNLNFCEDYTHGLELNVWKPFEMPPHTTNNHLFYTVFLRRFSKLSRIIVLQSV